LLLLAEAAPDEFLSALEVDFRQSAPAITALFEKDADGFFSSSPHTGLMWALGLLAWDTSHLAQTVLALATLIKLDTGGRINPRPAGVMFDIFRFWYPQTSATIDERLAVLELLSKREPDTAWTLLLGLIPEGHDTATPSAKPRWRNCDSPQPKTVTDDDIRRQAEWAATRLIQIAEHHQEKWPQMLKDFAKLPPVAQNAVLKWLIELDPESLSESARRETWEQVRELVQTHRFFHDAWWAMPKPTVDGLAELEEKLRPNDPIARHKWLFDNGTTHAFGNMEIPHEERDRMHVEAQMHAVRDVYEKLGLEGVFQLGLGSQSHFCLRIGDCLAKSGLLRDWQELLPEKLLSNNEHEWGIALGYAAGRQSVDGKAWVESMPLEGWAAEAVGVFGLILNFERQTWQMLRLRKPDAEAFYWRRVRPWAGRCSDSELEEAVGALLQNGRPMVAIDAITSAIHGHKKPSWKLVADAVDLASLSSGNPADGGFNTMSIWELVEAMKYLQADPAADQDRLVSLEWRLLPLARHNHFEPRILHSELSRNPKFFAEVLSVIYRAKNQPKEEKLDQAKQNIAQAGHSLLESWTGLPGAKPDGKIDADSLNSWVVESRKICAETGRIEVCDLKIGEQLSYAPSDEDGSWPCQAVRDVLETVTSDEIVRGFDIGVHNQRGVTSRGMNDGGEQERDLAKKYRTYAENCKVTWPRTALALRRIAEHYVAQAKRYDEHAESRD